MFLAAAGTGVGFVSHNAKLLEAPRVNGTTAKLMEAEQAETTSSLSQFR